MNNNNIAKIYLNLIKRGRDIETIPATVRNIVKEELKKEKEKLMNE